MKWPRFDKRWLLPAIPAVACSSCFLVDQQYEAARYGDFGNAVDTECRYAGSGVFQGGASGCAHIASCVRIYLAQKDNSEPRVFLRIRDEFRDQMREFIYNQPSAFTVLGEPIKPDGELQGWQDAFEFQIRPDGEILRWSPVTMTWISDSRNIRDESLPLRVKGLIEAAQQRGDTAALQFYIAFLDARRACAGRK